MGIGDDAVVVPSTAACEWSKIGQEKSWSIYIYDRADPQHFLYKKSKQIIFLLNGPTGFVMVLCRWCCILVVSVVVSGSNGPRVSLSPISLWSPRRSGTRARPAAARPLKRPLVTRHRHDRITTQTLRGSWVASGGCKLTTSAGNTGGLYGLEGGW